MVESLSRMPAPIVYPANAHKIGLLEKDAMDVVIVYGLLDIAHDGVVTAHNDLQDARQHQPECRPE